MKQALGYFFGFALFVVGIPALLCWVSGSPAPADIPVWRLCVAVSVALAGLALCCAFLTLDVTLGWNVFGLFETPHYTVIGGWSLTPDQIYIAFTRLLYPCTG